MEQHLPATVGKKRQRLVVATEETAAAETAGDEAAAAPPLEAADAAEPTLMELQAAEQQALAAKQAAHAAVLAATASCDEAEAASERAHALGLSAVMRDCRTDSDDVQRQLAREHAERQRAARAAVSVALEALVEAEDASASACWEHAVAMVRWLVAERDSWRALLEEREADWEEEAAELRDQNEDLRAEVRMLASALLRDPLTPAQLCDLDASGVPLAYVRQGRICYDVSYEWLETRRSRRECAALKRQLRRGAHHARTQDEGAIQHGWTPHVACSWMQL